MTTTTETTAIEGALAALEPLAQEKWVQSLQSQWDKPERNTKQFHTKLSTKLGDKRKTTKHAKQVVFLDAALAALTAPAAAKPPAGTTTSAAGNPPVGTTTSAAGKPATAANPPASSKPSAAVSASSSSMAKCMAIIRAYNAKHHAARDAK